MKIFGKMTVAVIAISVGCAISPVDAQSWLDRGKELLQGSGSGSQSGSGSSSLSNSEVSGGLREALRVGSERVVDDQPPRSGPLSLLVH
jgi:hypothetical protein